RNRSHWSTSKTPSYTKSVSWQHHPTLDKGQYEVDWTALSVDGHKTQGKYTFTVK
ncbi:copper resistance protein CopC, partial [Escherichia coli]